MAEKIGLSSDFGHADEDFVTIQEAIDDLGTLNRHTIPVS